MGKRAPEELKVYKEYISAVRKVEQRLVAEGNTFYRKTDWAILEHYAGRDTLFENKLREARFNALLQKVGIAPVFIENWLPTLYKTDVLGELPSFRFIYKSFMADHFSRKFLALPPGFRTSRCKCKCAEDCSASNLDCCISDVSTDATNVRLTYDASRRLAFPNRIRTTNYELIECSGSCKCGPGCPNRITQRGRQVAVVIFFENTEKNWGLRAGEPIRRGQFITEYVGEVKLASSLKYSNKAYQLQIPRTLEFDDKSESLVIDASGFGNEARFINHSCSPNALLVWVYSDDYGGHYARSCFFATRDIQAGEEIMYNYYSGAELKKKVKSGIKCRCSFKCNIYIPGQTEQRSDTLARASRTKPGGGQQAEIDDQLQSELEQQQRQ
ncbi:hypothetical protein WR25_08515 [Diploscapter pachys]|uniref:SET domain-containing protein n=1 Tax=Diploscapter pachys TaxID=2018661 RepID=A0A2A2LFL0_9BILA|nr:hypothetical protein WR25_08515 [Diploscapter pachys]